MANLAGGSFKRLSANDVSTRASTLNQLVDVIQEDVSGSATRRKYQVFVTGGIGIGVTSSLFQTVYDQDFSLQTANPIFDMTVGLFVSGATVTGTTTGTAGGKLLFPSTSLMMREKVDIYKQYTANLIGDADAAFYAPFGSTTATDRIDEALFVSYKRLFARDKIKRETYATRIYRSGADGGGRSSTHWHQSNLDRTSISGSAIFSDIGAAAQIKTTFGGEVGNVVDASNTAETVGLIFYDQGTVVFDMAKVFSGSQHMTGTIASMSPSETIDSVVIPSGYTVMGYFGSRTGETWPKARFIPDFITSGSIDDIVDHIASTRFQSGSLTSATFQNVTNINSTLIFCRATADEFNYSSNPTFTDVDGRIRVIDSGQEDTQRTFSFITTVGLHDEFGNLLAVAKLSRPIHKNDERDLTLRLRLDF